MRQEFKREVVLMTVDRYNELSISVLNVMYRWGYSVFEVDGVMVFYR